MTLKEATNLVGLAIANFPNMQEKDMRPTAKLWMQMLSDIPYSIAEKAILRSLSTAKFFPTVAEIREAAVLLTKPEIPTAIEAWGEVMNAIRRYGYYRPNEALASMTPITKSIVKKIGWREINMCEEIEVLRGQFRMAYESQAKRDKEKQLLPQELQNLIDGISNHSLKAGDIS